MKRKIYVIMFIVLISIKVPFTSFARTYINENGVADSANIEEDDDIEDEEEEESGEDSGVVGPGAGIDSEAGDSTGEGVSYTEPFETINGRKYWVGWRKYHYNFTATPIARKGEPIEYTYQIINTMTGTKETKTASAIAKGYGLYSMDYNKHILGLLYYMSRKIGGNNYLSSYVPDDVIEFNSDGTQVEQENRLMDVACKEVADRIIETFYSSDYEQGKFKEFWKGSFTGDKANILGKLQSEFYCNAYAVNAIRKLNDMGFPFDEVSSKERAALYGMIFSIMESRYRDKNLNGKTNLQLKVSEGDLWPFLVYCENITAKKQGSKWVYTYEWPDIDTIVDGAYQWMYYYDSKFETSTSASTITSLMVQNEVDDEADEADWEEEYLELTNEDSFPYLNQYKLQEFYSRVAKVRSTFKKSKENTQGIFGAEEIYDITSEVSYTTAMEDMKKAMVDMCKGTELSTVWKGLTAENIARTYMMAKNIVENERVQEEYAYYNIGTNVINATPGLKGNEYMLVDFERIRLEQPLKVKDKNGNATIKTYADTDKDGLYDRNELGKDGEAFDYYDITKFIEKMVLSELYGSHYKIVNELPSERKESVTYLTKSQVNDIMTNFKKNLIRRRKDDSASDESKSSFMSRANTVDAKEQAEYYLNCFKKEDANGSLYATEADAETAKIKVELYAFDSNPIFKDTDFDGVPDGKGYAELQRLGNEYGRDTHTGRVMYNNLNEYMKVDLEPQNNKVSGEMKTTGDRIGKTLWIFGENAFTHMDYRYFFMNNKNYYDELSTMSLMLCNTLEHNENSGSGDLANLTTLFRRIGLKKWNDESEVEIKTAKYGSNGEVKYVVGENEIEYTHNYSEETISKKVKLIVVKSIDVGKDNIEKIGNNKNNINNHELFEGLAKAIYDKEFKGQEFCYWVTGYNTGGAVANVLAAKMIDKGLYYVPKGGIASNSNAYITYDNGQKSTQSKRGQVITNVYAYTFGAPNTVYNGNEVDEVINTTSSKYCSIFNVVESDDISAFVPTNKTGWTKYGILAIKQSNAGVRSNLEEMINQIFLYNQNNLKTIYYDRIGNKNLYDVNKEIVEEFLLYNGRILTMDSKINILNYLSNSLLKSKFTEIINYVNLYSSYLNYSKDEGTYYKLSKSILPEDLTFNVPPNNRVEKYDDSMEISFKEVLEKEFNLSIDDGNDRNGLIEAINKLYKGILMDAKDSYEANVVFHKLIGNAVYFSERQDAEIIYLLTQFAYNVYDYYSSGAGAIGPDPIMQLGWLVYVALWNLYDSYEELAMTIKEHTIAMRLSTVANYYNNRNELRERIGMYLKGLLYEEKSVTDICSGIWSSHYNYKEQNSKYNDIADLSLTLSVEMNDNKENKQKVGRDATRFNGIDDIDAQYGFIGNICGVFGSAPELTYREYMANLDAVNLYHRYKKNKNKEIYDIFCEYYDGINDNSINRAEEFLTHYNINKLKEYRSLYKTHMDWHRLYYNDKNYNNRLMYFDNFILNLEKKNQTLEKILDYKEYDQNTKKMIEE